MRHSQSGPPWIGVLVDAVFFDEDAPLIACSIDGHAGECMVDTGNGGETIVEGRWAAREGLSGRFAVGKQDANGFYSTRATIAFGPVVLRDQPVAYSTPAPRGSESTTTVAAILSENILQRYRMTIDYGRHGIWLARLTGDAVSR